MGIGERTIEVGILGATGTVGQQFAVHLAAHPWFRVTWLGASARSEGKRYRDLAWRLPEPLPESMAELVVESATPGRAPRLVFSALDAAVAGEIERAFAEAGHLVVSNARNFRMDPCVPLLVPEVNPDHLALIPIQRQEKGWSGAIVTNPNCSTVFLAMSLAALRAYEPTTVVVTTLQAASGAGYPGVPSLDLIGNVVPHIGGEEAKVESEPQKIMGRLRHRTVEPHPMIISAQTTRVGVVNGHTEAISVKLARSATEADIRAAFEGFRGRPQELGLPSAPPQPLRYLPEEDRPQPRLDADRDHGMGVCIGRLRPCPVLDFKFIALGHNTVRGAAGAAVLNAELMVADGLLED